MAPWRHNNKAVKSEMKNESARPVKSHSHGPEPETLPKPMLAPAVCNEGSHQVSDVLCTVQRWRMNLGKRRKSWSGRGARGLPIAPKPEARGASES